jgi:hypothetical protein
MASPFQRYQSGIQPVTGMLEAGTNIGNAYLNAGSGIAENINKYFETKAKNDVITGQGEQLAQNLTGYYNVLSKDPEFQQYAEQFIKPTLDSLSNLHELNFNKKAGVVAGAQARYQDMANSLNLYQKMKELELKRTIAEGEGKIPKVKATGEKPAVAITRWNPYKSGIENYNDFRTQLQNARKAGFKGDDNEAIYNWLDSVADDAMDGTFEGLSPEQSQEMRGVVQDQIYALREKLSDELSGATPYEGDVSRSGMTAKDFLANRSVNVGAKTVVTDASGATKSVTLPAPASETKINRGPIARIVNTPRGLVRVEVNQAYPDDMIHTAGAGTMDLSALKGYTVGSGSSTATPPATSSTPAPAPAPATSSTPASATSGTPTPATPPAKEATTTAVAPAPATLPTPPSKEETTPASNADAEKAREINRLTKEQMILNAYLTSLDKARIENPGLMPVIEVVGKALGLNHEVRDEDGNIIINEDDAGKVRARFAANAKRLVELRGGGDSAVTDALPPPESKKTNTAPAPATLPAPPTKEATKTEEDKYDFSTRQYARSMGVSVEEVDKAVKESGLPSYEWYKQIREAAEKEGITPEQYFKGINAPAEEALPPPPSQQAQTQTAPAGLPEPEKPAPRVVIPNSKEAKEIKNTRLIELGAQDDGQGKIRYEIQKGDTPARIAKRFGYSQKAVEDLMKADGLDPRRLQVGNTFSLSDYEPEGSAPYSPDESASDASDESTSDSTPVADKITFSKDGKVIRPAAGDAVKKTETAFVRLAHGRALTKAEREIEATKKSITGLTRYMEKLASPEPYYGAAVNFYGGFTTNEDFYVPEFDQEFMDIDDTLGGVTNVKGGFAVTSNPLKETEAWKESWKTLYDLHDRLSYSRYTGGTVGKAIFGDAWSIDNKIEAKEAIQKQINALEARLPTLIKEREKLGSKTPTYAEIVANKNATGTAVPDAALPETPPLMREVRTTVGTQPTSVNYTQEERKDLLKAFLMERYKDSEGRSYIPSGFDTIYSALHPEANLKIIDTPIGPMYWDGNSYKQAQQTSKQMTTQDIREAKRGVFGTQTEKGWIPEELGEGTGVYLAGLFNRSDADLAKFDEMAQNNAQALAALRGIKEVLRIPLHSIPIGKKRAEAFGRVQAYIASLKAAMRTDIVGVGTVSNFEQAMIAKAVPDPSEFWRLDDADWGRIYEIEKRLKNQIINTGAMKGVTVMIKEPEAEKDVESALRAGNKRLK